MQSGAHDLLLITRVAEPVNSLPLFFGGLTSDQYRSTQELLEETEEAIALDGA